MIFLCSGDGGHEEQMRRVSVLLEPLDDKSFFLLASRNFLRLENYICIGEVRSKKTGSLGLRYLCNALKIIINAILLEVTDRDVAITTGPGNAALAALILKIKNRNVKIIHIETWSRFQSKSLAGRIMHNIADRFYVQNIELTDLYPKSIYSGRL